MSSIDKNLAQEVLDRSQSLQKIVIPLRRSIHENPEIGFDLFETAKKIEKALEGLGLNLKTGVAKSGILAELEVNADYPWVALRADMDALPMNEGSGENFTSQIQGAAHMCGHDAHSAMLVGAAHVLSQLKSKLRRNVRFIFQPSEEALPGGAPGMIEGGALEGVEEVFGIHVWPFLKSGDVGICQGPTMAQPDTFEIEITGIGGHAAVPQLCIDPILVASHLIQAFQSLVSRSTDPLKSCVLSVTRIQGGSADNVIPEKITLGGTMRTFEADVKKRALSRLREIVETLPRAFGARATLSYQDGYPPLINEKNASEKARQVAEALVGSKKTIWPAEPCMGGEDFAFYLQNKPGTFVFLGNHNEEVGATFMCHDPRFRVDEGIFPLGVSLHSLFALTR